MSVKQVENPPGYPQEWEADVLLTDGGVAHLRPIRPSDADRLVAFYGRISPESKYMRFFAPYPRLSDRDVKRFTEVDYVDRVAFIVTLGEDMIAVGRYDRAEGDRAEVAFLIEDAHQGRGIAQLLLEHLAEAARERGHHRASSPRCCRRTAGWPRSSSTPATGSPRESRTACWPSSSRSCRPTPRSG